MKNIDIHNFTKKNITKRSTSLFEIDIENNKNKLSEKIKDKSILVIGGAGTIGKSFIKAILKFEPKRLYVIDTNENGLTELTRDLRSTDNQFIPEDYKTYPMNFGDSVFKKLFIKEGPFEIVANFAAHKHVRSEKDKYSIEAMLENNVFKAKELLELLLENKPEHFFCVSTDKASNPVNIMGASKKLMEEVIMAYSDEFPITTARFANVSFSNGSLLQGHIERINKNQPISCPSDIKRFFVSEEESGQICMLACVLGKSSDIFFPKLEKEEMVFFKDITHQLISEFDKKITICTSEDEAKKLLSITNESNVYPVYYFDTDTSGEKHYEEFYSEKDSINLSRFQNLGVINNRSNKSITTINKIVEELRFKFQEENYEKDDIIALLNKYLPDFSHSETGKSLDQKM
jgi:FlaA1/EpsC-like NDP-sugar epimerase